MADEPNVAEIRGTPDTQCLNRADLCALPAQLDAPSGSPKMAMKTTFRPAIVIAAYDCVATIATVVREARAHALPILVVDDGSCDRTAAVAREAGAEVLVHAVNRGKGAALVTGMRALASRRFTHALTMDGDGQHLADQIPALLARASHVRTALVIGARRIGDQPVAALNLLGNRVANLAVRLAIGLPIPDTQSGFRVYPLAAILRLPACGERFEYESTVLIRAARAGIPIDPVAVAVHYPPVAERRSHYRKVRDTLRIMRAVAPLLVSGRRPLPVS